LKRFAVISAFAALLVGIVAMPSGAASFIDYTPCPASGPLLVCPTGQVGQPYNVQLLAHSGCDVYRWEIPNGSTPVGTSLASSGLVSGTPTTVGEWMPWVIVHDLTAGEGGPSWCGGDSQSERQFVFRVVPGLSIRDDAVPNATIRQAYSKTLGADSITSLNPRTGAPASATWGVASGTLPAGITLAANGVLSGTPTSEGTYTFVVRATGGGGATDTETYTIAVRQPVSAASPFIRGASAPKAEVGVPFTAAQNATGGTGTYTWTVASGSLPAGLVLEAATGTLSGTPTTPGRYSFVLRATDTEGRVANVNATLNVAAKLAITTRTLKAAKVGQSYRAKIAKVGGVAPIAWTVTGKLPKGLKFASKLGVFLGKPTQSGKFRVTVVAVDALEVEAQKRLIIVVKA
jgi:large repetitive protein